MKNSIKISMIILTTIMLSQQSHAQSESSNGFKARSGLYLGLDVQGSNVGYKDNAKDVLETFDLNKTVIEPSITLGWANYSAWGKTGWGLELKYSAHTLDGSLDVRSGLDLLMSNLDLTILQVQFNPVLYYSLSERFTFYATPIGLSIIAEDGNFSSILITNSSTTTDYSDISTIDLGINFAAGFLLHMSESWALKAGATYTIVTGSDDIGDKVDFGLGIRYTF